MEFIFATMELIYSLDDIAKAAEKLITLTGQYKVFALNGNLGAGKTTFVQTICKKLGVEQNISSPTFSIINEYTAKGNTIYHIDLYRIKDEEEAIRAGVEECLYSNALCFVEWPERALGLFPAETVNLHFEIISDTQRKLIIKVPE
jgi:tRNA threonylcarbamoyladenosine biosynthesis protein TsaE